MADILQQLLRFKHMLKGVSHQREAPIYKHVLTFLRTYQGELLPKEKDELVELVRIAFNITEASLFGDVNEKPKLLELQHQNAAVVEAEGWKFAPTGIFRDYLEYTRRSEPPISYHLFSCLSMLGACIGRRVFIDMGIFKIYPTMGVIIVGPSGIKKTTAADIAIGFLRESELTKIYAEKMTPEYIADELKDFAQGVLYAPEMVVFLGRQRYMDGAVPLITRLLDNPDRWDTGTITRKKKTLTDVAISTLFCSVPDWLITGASEDIFTGGFMARHVLVVQYDTVRCEPRPRVPPHEFRNKILTDMCRIHEYRGEMRMSDACDQAYDTWYRAEKGKLLREEHEIIRTYLQRKHAHTLKVAIIYHLANCGDLELCASCFDLATRLLSWNEQFLPPLFRQLFKTREGAEAEFVLKHIRMSGGLIDHSELVRKVEYKMNAQQLKRVLDSLLEGQRIEEKRNPLYHTYLLKEQL